jgi:acyl-CoA synthetase (AMP-forming)/AMP-acid ligase II
MSLDLCSVAFNARRCPGQMAVSWAGRSIAWDAFNNYVHSTSRYLKEISVRPQETVFVVKENSPAHVIVLLALWRIGAVPCLIDPHMLKGCSDSLYASVKPALVISPLAFKRSWGQKVRWANIEQVVAYGYNDSFLGSEASLDPMIDSDQVAFLRLKISESVVQTDLFTHAALRKNPESLSALFHSLTTAETYII